MKNLHVYRVARIVIGAWLATSLSLVSLPSVAGATAPATINMIITLPEHGVALLHTNAPTISSPAPCNVTPGFAFSLRDPGGRALLNQLLHAQTMGYQVEVVGNNQCTLWSLAREDVLYVRIIYP